MDPTTSELLERRHDDGSLAVRNGLRALPELAPPPGAWDRIFAEHRRRRRTRMAWRAAAAAVIVVAVLMTAAGHLWSPMPRPNAATGSIADVRDLVDASHDLERVLRTPALQSPVLRPVQAARIVALEDQIAVIDAELGALGPRLGNDRAAVLWSDRVEILDKLVRARGGVVETQDIRPALHEANGREP